MSNAAVLGGRAYIVGGTATRVLAGLNVVESYDPVAGSWRAEMALPNPTAPMSATTSAVVGGYFHLIGGVNGNTSYNQVYRFRP